MNKTTAASKLPLKQDIGTAWTASIFIAALMGILSIAGLVLTDSIYPSEELLQSYLVNDVINLILGLPILIGSMWLTYRKKLAGLLFWPGALLYVIYNYIAYIIGIPLGLLTIAFTALVLLSAFAIYYLLIRIDIRSVKGQLAGKVTEKIAGWFLVIFGILFIIRAINIFITAGVDQAALPLTEIGVTIADVVISILWVIAGLLLLRKKPLGYTIALGLLFAASMLFVGLIILLLIQPVFTSAEFSIVDILILAVMGLVFSIPFVLYLRGILKSSENK